MPSPRSHLLSITLTPDSADIVEAKRAGSAVQVARRSTLVFAADGGLDQPASLGAALAGHLKENGYGTKHAVIGLCPRWVLSRHKHVPPADKDAMRGIVNLQIEREFAASASEMRFDYLLGQTPDADGKVSLLLAGARESVLQQVEQAALAAGLKVHAVTPTSLAVAAGCRGTVIFLESGVAGVMRVADGAVLGLASCQADPAGLGEAPVRARLLTDLSRCMLQLPGSEADAGLTLIVPGSVSQADAQQLTEEAAERFGDVQTRQADTAELLADEATRPGTTLIDFNASRLAPPKRKRLSPTAQWAVRAAVIVLLIGGTFGYLWLDATQRRDNLQSDYDAIKDTAAQLQAMRTDTRRAQGWYDKRPPAHECMRELTRTFPLEGEIRVESLVLNDDMSGTIDCSAEDRQTMDAYFTQMRRSGTLLQVDLGNVRPSRGEDNWIDFPIAFRFDPAQERGTP